MNFEKVKFEIFIPCEYLPVLREGLHDAGAGRIGNYDHCLSVSEVSGFWRPLEGSIPFEGTTGQLSSGQECKVEVVCGRENVQSVIDAIKSVHPYEEPVFYIIPLLNSLYAQD
jgi:hypothetical protein